MGGPIVRTGTTPKFWENWEQVFGDKKKTTKKGKKKVAKTKAKKKK